MSLLNLIACNKYHYVLHYYYNFAKLSLYSSRIQCFCQYTQHFWDFSDTLKISVELRLVKITMSNFIPREQYGFGHAYTIETARFFIPIF